MKMKNWLKPFLLNTALTAAALGFHNDGLGQNTGVHADDHAKKKKPPVILMTMDKTHGDTTSATGISSLSAVRDIYRGFRLNRVDILPIGDGKSLPHDYDEKLDSMLKVMEKNKLYTLFYDAHGSTDGYMHKSEMGTSQIDGKKVHHGGYTSEILGKPIKKAIDTQIPLESAILSCESDGFYFYIQNLYAEKKEGENIFAPGTKILTCSKLHDFSFSVPSQVIAGQMGIRPDITFDMMTYYYLYNKFLFSDTFNNYKYKDSQSGASILVVNEKGEPEIYCPRRSVTEHCGLGLKKEEQDMIFQNWVECDKRYDLDYGINEEEILKNIKEADELMKGHDDFLGMSKNDQRLCIKVMTHKREKWPLENHVSYLADEANATEKRTKKFETPFYLFKQQATNTMPVFLKLPPLPPKPSLPGPVQY